MVAVTHTARWVTAEWKNLSSAGEDMWTIALPVIKDGVLYLTGQVLFAEAVDWGRQRALHLEGLSAVGEPLSLQATLHHVCSRPARRKSHRFSLEIPLNGADLPSCLRLRLVVVSGCSPLPVTAELTFGWP